MKAVGHCRRDVIHCFTDLVVSYSLLFYGSQKSKDVENYLPWIKFKVHVSKCHLTLVNCVLLYKKKAEKDMLISSQTYVCNSFHQVCSKSKEEKAKTNQKNMTDIFVYVITVI
jgi:hypothetical protein